ncbi:MAG: S41 family peptidase [Polyangiaceae bacterium]
MKRVGARGLGFMAGALAALVAPAAQAGSFNDNGDFSFGDNTAATEGFESFTATTGITIADSSADSPSLEGTKFAQVKAQQAPATVSFTLSDTNTVSVRIRMYLRSGSLFGGLYVDYPATDTGGPGAIAALYPTGLVTSDGWYEVVSGPVRVEQARTPAVGLYMLGSADVDAIELERVADVPGPVPCDNAGDPICGAGHFCAAGWCRDGAQFVPPLPPADQRAAIASYLEGRLRVLFGGRYTRQERMPLALASLSAMADASDAWTYWNSFITGIHLLHDWHSSTNGPQDFTIGARNALTVCFVEGEGDLSHAQWPADPVLKDVLVSHTGTAGNAGLKPGDRIVAVDGVHPITFAESLANIDWGTWHSDDPNGHAEAVERLGHLIQMYAKELTVVRCDGATQQCSDPETLQVKDLDPEDGSLTYPNCDHRPMYHLASNGPDAATHAVYDVYHGLLADSQPGENLYGVVWNDVYLTDTSDANNTYKPAMDELRANASGVILDHRTGNGGTELAAEYLTKLFIPPSNAVAVSASPTGTYGWFDDPFDDAAAMKIYNSLKGSYSAYNIGASNARTDMPTAVLLARDGSASDWWPLGMKGGPKVRLFGRQTAGAFSTFTEFKYYGMGWQLASGDLIMKDGSTRLGQGVQPDEEVLPRQSDLLVGKDTAYERALEWVRSCLTGACQ